MKNRYSWNFLVPEFSILEYSVWKFSVLGFYFPENSGIPVGSPIAKVGSGCLLKILKRMSMMLPKVSKVEMLTLP